MLTTAVLAGDGVGVCSVVGEGGWVVAGVGSGAGAAVGATVAVGAGVGSGVGEVGVGEVSGVGAGPGDGAGAGVGQMLELAPEAQVAVAGAEPVTVNVPALTPVGPV